MTRKEKLIVGLAVMQAMDCSPIKLSGCARYILIYLYLIGGRDGFTAGQLRAIIARDLTCIVHNLRYLEDIGYIDADRAQGKTGRRYKLTGAGYTIMRNYDIDADRRIEAQTLLVNHSEKTSRLAETQLASTQTKR